MKKLTPQQKKLLMIGVPVVLVVVVVVLLKSKSSASTTTSTTATTPAATDASGADLDGFENGITDQLNQIESTLGDGQAASPAGTTGTVYANGTTTPLPVAPLPFGGQRAGYNDPTPTTSDVSAFYAWADSLTPTQKAADGATFAYGQSAGPAVDNYLEWLSQQPASVQQEQVAAYNAATGGSVGDGQAPVGNAVMARAAK